MNFKIRYNGATIPVLFVEHDALTKIGVDIKVLEDGEFLFGMYRSLQQIILLNKEHKQWFEVFMHELLEYVKTAYGVDIDHDHLSVISKVLADIMKQNKKEFIRMLEEDN
jgi:hypothetical protein